MYSSSAGALAILKYVYSEFGIVHFAFRIVYSCATGAAAIALTNAYVLCSVLWFLYFIFCILYCVFRLSRCHHDFHLTRPSAPLHANARDGDGEVHDPGGDLQ